MPDNRSYEKPGWIMTSEAGSFAEYTIKVRKPEIIDQIIVDNPYPQEIIEELNQLKQEIALGTIRNLMERTPDQLVWNRLVNVYGPVSWFSLPWYFAESFFYRRVLEITQYYKPSSPFFLRDPFQKQKRQQTGDDLVGLDRVMISSAGTKTENLLPHYVNGALWANRADLSNNSIKMAKEFHAEASGGEHLFLLDDDTDYLHRFLVEKNKSIAYFVDNVGREFFADLMLVDYLIDQGFADEVVVFVKSAPLFVSDVTEQDVLIGVNFLLDCSNEMIWKLGLRLLRYHADGKLRVRAEPLLNLPLMLEEMPSTLIKELSNYDLVVFKGDANYRRVLGDRHWSFTSRLNDVVAYFPTNLLLIRTLKSELAAGLTPVVIREMESVASDWLINGTCGVIQFVESVK